MHMNTEMQANKLLCIFRIHNTAQLLLKTFHKAQHHDKQNNGFNAFMFVVSGKIPSHFIGTSLAPVACFAVTSFYVKQLSQHGKYSTVPSLKSLFRVCALDGACLQTLAVFLSPLYPSAPLSDLLGVKEIHRGKRRKEGKEMGERGRK